MSTDFLAYPPSFDSNRLANSFHVDNGEIGVLPLDVPEFLAACGNDGIAILGGEMWLSDYRAAFEGNPIPQKGSWCGLIPWKGKNTTVVVSYSTKSRRFLESWNKYVQRTITETQGQINEINIDNEVETQYIPSVRFNFTLKKK